PTVRTHVCKACLSISMCHHSPRERRHTAVAIAFHPNGEALPMRPRWILACLGMAAFIGSCSDDNNNPDSPTGSTVDARTVDAGAGSSVDAAPAVEKVFTVNLTTAAEDPACGAAGASAAGTAMVTISADNSTVTAAVTYTGLSSSPPTMG